MFKNIHLCVKLPRREWHSSDRRQRSLAVRGCVQDSLQALLQHVVSCGATRGVDELRVQVEGAWRGSARELGAAASLEASLEDLTQLWRSVLEESSEILYVTYQ